MTELNATEYAAAIKGDNVKVSATDTTFDVLQTKLVQGANVTITKINAGANEQLSIGGPTSNDRYVKVNSSDTTTDYLDNKVSFTGAVTSSTGTGANGSYRYIDWNTASFISRFPDYVAFNTAGWNMRSGTAGASSVAETKGSGYSALTVSDSGTVTFTGVAGGPFDYCIAHSSSANSQALYTASASPPIVNAASTGISIWVWLDSLPQQTGNFLVGKNLTAWGVSGGTPILTLLQYISGSWYTVANTTKGTIQAGCTRHYIPIRRWILLGCVYYQDGFGTGSLSMSVNGEVVASTLIGTATDTLTGTDGCWSVGGAYNRSWSSGPLNCRMADFRVWDSISKTDFHANMAQMYRRVMSPDKQMGRTFDDVY
jgi:hypothetical protein